MERLPLPLHKPTSPAATAEFLSIAARIPVISETNIFRCQADEALSSCGDGAVLVPDEKQGQGSP